jgi:hypothetical protein
MNNGWIQENQGHSVSNRVADTSWDDKLHEYGRAKHVVVLPNSPNPHVRPFSGNLSTSEPSRAWGGGNTIAYEWPKPQSIGLEPIVDAGPRARRVLTFLPTYQTNQTHLHLLMGPREEWVARMDQLSSLLLL